MWISERDEDLLKAFIEREAKDFKFRNFGREEVYRNRMYSLCKTEMAKIREADYIEIESLTNLGLLDRKLVLSCQPWVRGVRYCLMLPVSPGGGMHIQQRTAAQKD